MEDKPSSKELQELYEKAYFFYAGGKYIEAEEIFRLLTFYAPKQYEFWMGLGASFQLQKKYQEAINSFGIVAVLDSNELNPLPYIHASECFWSLNEKREAHLALSTAISIAQKQKKYSLLLKKLQFIQNRWT